MKKKRILKGLTVVFVLLLVVLGIMVGIRANAQDEAGKITLSKTAVATSDNRGADVTLEVNTSELEAPTVDVVLIMDKSGSMDYTLSGGGYFWEPRVTRMDAAHTAANAMVNALLNGENKENVRISYVTFSTGVDSNNVFYTYDKLADLTKAINNTTANGGTNLQASLVKANELLEGSTADYKMVVVVTDGEPSYFTINGVTHGVGSKDAHETCGDTGDNNLAGAKYTDYSYSNNRKTRTRSCVEKDGTVLYIDTENKTCGWGQDWCDPERTYPNGEPMKPSEAAKIAADTLKENGANIYGIGFGSDAASLGNFLTNDVASGAGFVYTANDTDALSTAMNNIANEINSLLAINAKVVDVVPKEFALPTESFEMVAIDKEDKETVIPNDKVNFVTCDEEEMAKEGTKCSEVGQTIIDLDMGNIVSTVKTYRITYHVDAKPEYSGAIFTNKEATFTATATEANGYYEDKNINIPFDKPVVAVGAVTNNDDYTKTPVLDGKTEVYDVMANDSEILQNKTVQYVNNAGTYTAHEGTTNVTTTLVIDSTSCGTATVVDNKISYDSTGCSRVNDGNVEIKYHVNLVVNIDGNETVIDSKDATGAVSSSVSIKVNKVPTSYVVKYIDEDGKKVAEDKTVEGAFVGDTVKENAVEAANYDVDENEKSLTLANENNEIVFNYSFKEVSYVVMGVDKISKETLYNDQTGKGKVTKTVETEAQTVKGYDLFGEAVQTLTLDSDVSKNVIVYYYLPRKTVTTVIKVEGQEDEVSTQEYAYDSEYSTTGLENIPEGFELKSVTGEVSGRVTEDIQVVYTYGLKELSVTTVYEYEGKDSVRESTTYKYGDSYETHGDSNLADGYVLAENGIVGTEKGIVKDNVTVTYKYVLQRVTITTVCKYEGLEDVVDEKEYVYGESYSTNCEVNNNYEEKEVPEETTGTATEDKTITYEYSKKKATLVVRYLEEGTDAVVATGKNENVYWGDTYSEDAPVVKYYDLVSETSHHEGVINGDVTITYYYAKKDGGVTVNHVLTGTNASIADSTFEEKKYGEPYETSPLDDYRYELIGLADDSDPATGNVEKDNVEVTYVYKQRVGTVKVLHLEEGTEKELKSSEFTKKYGEDYRTMDAEASLPNYELASQYPENAQGTVKQELEVVKYYYRLRKANYVVKYLEKGTETPLAPEINKVVNYGEEYEATDSSEIPANYQRVETVGDEVKGVISKYNYQIIFYYEKKNSSIDSEIKKESTSETITELNQVVPYTITYHAEITDYIGNAVVTIIDELPYAIDEKNSNLSGGEYDSEKNTITWVEEVEINSYVNPEINITKKIELVYSDLDATKRVVTNDAKANITLDNGESNNATETSVDMEIEGVINIQYIDIETGEVLGEEKTTALVGEVLEAEEKEFDDYTLTVIPEEEEFVYTVEEHDVKFYYVKNQVEGVTKEDEDGEVLGVNETNPKTNDDVVMFAVLLGISILGIAITTKKIVNRQN